MQTCSMFKQDDFVEVMAPVKGTSDHWEHPFSGYVEDITKDGEYLTVYDEERDSTYTVPVRAIGTQMLSVTAFLHAKYSIRARSYKEAIHMIESGQAHPYSTELDDYDY